MRTRVKKNEHHGLAGIPMNMMKNIGNINFVDMAEKRMSHVVVRVVDGRENTVKRNKDHADEEKRMKNASEDAAEERKGRMVWKKQSAVRRFTRTSLTLHVQTSTTHVPDESAPSTV
jgi:hypothetical protein